MKALSRKEQYLAYLQDKVDNIPTPTTREEKLLHDMCLHDDMEDTNSGGGVTTWDELEGKPFGESVENVVILEKDNLTGGPASGAKEGYGYDTTNILAVSALVPGDTYIVTVDGAEYTGVVTSYPDEYTEGGTGVELFADGYAEAPIWLVSYATGIYAYFGDDGYTSHSVKIVHVAKTVIPLPTEYIPETIARVADVGAKTVVTTRAMTADMAIECAKSLRTVWIVLGDSVLFVNNYFIDVLDECASTRDLKLYSDTNCIKSVALTINEADALISHWENMASAE